MTVPAVLWGLNPIWTVAHVRPFVSSSLRSFAVLYVSVRSRSVITTSQSILPFDRCLVPALPLSAPPLGWRLITPGPGRGLDYMGQLMRDQLAPFRSVRGVAVGAEHDPIANCVGERIDCLSPTLPPPHRCVCGRCGNPARSALP